MMHRGVLTLGVFAQRPLWLFMACSKTKGHAGSELATLKAGLRKGGGEKVEGGGCGAESLAALLT